MSKIGEARDAKLLSCTCQILDLTDQQLDALNTLVEAGNRVSEAASFTTGPLNTSHLNAEELKRSKVLDRCVRLQVPAKILDWVACGWGVDVTPEALVRHCERKLGRISKVAWVNEFDLNTSSF
jgi:hypothetical protein